MSRVAAQIQETLRGLSFGFVLVIDVGRNLELVDHRGNLESVGFELFVSQLLTIGVELTLTNGRSLRTSSKISRNCFVPHIA